MRLIPNNAGARPARFLCTLVFLLAVLGGCDSGSKRARTSSPRLNIARVVAERGALTYLARTYSRPGKLEHSSDVTGLLVMRRAADLRPLGGRYYDDGFGNLIGFGLFKTPKLGGRSRYALTFRKNGAMQLALDFRDDDVVDFLVELDRNGRLGGLASPDAQWLLDCMSEQIAAGSNMAAAANHCLESPGGGGGGGLGRGAEVEADRLSKPDCEEHGGLPGSVAQGGDGSVVIPLDNGDTIHATTTTNEDGSTTLSIAIVDSQGRLVYSERTTYDRNGAEQSSEIQRVTHNDQTGGAHWESERREDGRVVERSEMDIDPRSPIIDIEIGDAIIEHLEIEIGDAIIEEPRGRRGGGPTRQPGTGPECEDCPIEDPRCAPAPNDIASLWDCQAETGMSLWKCLERMRDVIYTATGGRCAVGTGPDDRPNIKCSDRQLTECLLAGGSVEDCLRRTGYIGDRESIGPENDDFLRDRFGASRGRVGLYIDSTPMGAVFLALCAEGMEQFCRGDGRF